ncbi:hypothetical protein FQA39_LY08756 [Lamprigera yunnana]|nr:hypothetical protein FQA39_LY08756 [Lamprigera yunnana]
MTYTLFYSLFRLLFGTLYPAYASYKAVKTKNVKEYVKWMMYWIVFALFTCAETFTDVFLSWFPFYYEIKIVLVLWLLSPATKGSSILYRKFVHPMFSKREHEIDEYIAKAKEQSYKQVLDLGSKGVNVLMQTAIKGGGGIVNQLRKSYSLSDLSSSPLNPSHEEDDETDSLVETVTVKKKRVHHTTSASSGIYFSEVDVRQDMSHVQSTEDLNLGYLSGDNLFSSKAQSKEGLMRSGSVSSTRPRSLRITRSVAVPKTIPSTAESNENEKKIVCEKSNSSSDEEFMETIESPNLISKEYTVCTSGELYKSNSADTLPLILNTKHSNERAGKYNKRVAPSPPPSTASKNVGQRKSLEAIPTIKATLVLTPGATSVISSNQNLNQSPSCKSTKKRTHSFSRFMMIPKKMQFWHKNLVPQNAPTGKRSSWYAELPKTANLTLMELKPFSKSADNFYASLKNDGDADSD